MQTTQFSLCWFLYEYSQIFKNLETYCFSTNLGFGALLCRNNESSRYKAYNLHLFYHVYFIHHTVGQLFQLFMDISGVNERPLIHCTRGKSNFIVTIWLPKHVLYMCMG